MRLRISPLNLRRSIRFHREVRRARAPLVDLTRYERRVFSQNGEDGIVEAILARIGAGARTCVEVGAEDGAECITRRLAEREGWWSLLLDAEHEVPERRLRRALVTAENVDALLRDGGVPPDLDLLAIDVDGNDYWIWAALSERWRPRVVVIEYNAQLGPSRVAAVPYDPAFRWDRTDYVGASLMALVRLGRRRGYTLVACDSFGVNAFFVRDDVARGHFAPPPPEALFRPPGYGRGRRGHPPHPTRRVPDLAADDPPAR
jgi:hypothetical protein